MTCIKEAFVDVWPPGGRNFTYQLENDFITSFEQSIFTQLIICIFVQSY